MNKCVLSASGSGHPVVCWLLTAAEMKRCDSNTSEIFGVPSVVLMERAALSCVDVIVSRQKKLEEQAGITTLAWGDVGFRNLTNSKHSVTSPDDLKGLKIRTMTNNLHVEYFTALGAIPTPMSFSELFTALQQKTVDGQENPTALIYNNALYEAQKAFPSMFLQRWLLILLLIFTTVCQRTTRQRLKKRQRIPWSISGS